MNRDWDDDNRVTSELYRLMPPPLPKPGQLAEALDAARGDGIREALDAAAGTYPRSAPPDSPAAWSAQQTGRWRQLAAELGRVVRRVDVWILIVGIVGVVIAYLTLLKT